jgi:TetR/AcrR family transcriptional repressor of lmrAB and yxaGH operons
MAEKSSKVRLVTSAARLIREKGYFGTGISEVLQMSGVPKGSLYHHFPDGKDGLVRDALVYASGRMMLNYEIAMRGTKDPETGLGAILDLLADDLESSGFRHGCPLATVALETGGEKPELAKVLNEMYEMWEEAVAGYLALKQVRGAKEKARIFITMLEGGLVLSKARSDVGFLRRIKGDLKMILDS